MDTGQLNHLPLMTAIMVMDSSMRILDCNERAVILVGRSLKSMRTLEACQFLPDLHDLIVRSSKAPEGTVSAVVTFNPELHCSPGRFIAVMTALPDGRFLLELTDTERVLELEAQRQKRTLSEASRVLFRNLAHELKNPLGGIRGAAQLLEMELPSAEMREYTDVIISEVDRLQALVDRLLAPYRNEIKTTSVNIHEVLEQVKNLVSVQYGNGLTIERDYDVSAPDVMADRERLVQVFLNLMQNAAQALYPQIAEGSARIRLVTRVVRGVVIHQQMCKMALCVDVLDNGPGIDASVADKIFYPLVTSKPTGTGLGLPLVKTYVEQHKGDIELIRRVGWTDFRVRLPLGREKK